MTGLRRVIRHCASLKCVARALCEALGPCLTSLERLLTTLLNVMVSSAVPEGKGVSSSASIEVATMSAIAAAHG
ncbi:hypothetical protein BHM03_00052765 [Ensete ventricosum]|nr:hypothetical protein BHM03_00052765 [Ensete ventricosum]